MRTINTLLLMISLMIMAPLRASADEKSGLRQVVKIGAVLHLTGEYAMQGEAFRHGVELAIEQLNSETTNKALKFEAVFEDTQYKPLFALTAAKKLAQDQSVVAVVISTVTEAKASGPVYEQSRLPAMVLWDSSPELDQIGQYVFGIGPWAPASGQKSAHFAREKLSAKKAVILNTNTEWSVYVSDWFEREFKRLGGQVVDRIEIDPNETDFRTILTRAKALDTDVFYVPIDSNIMPFFKQAKQLGITTPLITSDILDLELFNEGGDLFEGVFQTQGVDPSFPATQKMVQLFKTKYGNEPGFIQLTAWAYDGVSLIGELATRDGASRGKIKAGLYATKGYQGASGTITFNDKGSAPRPVQVFVVHSQALSPIG